METHYLGRSKHRLMIIMPIWARGGASLTPVRRLASHRSILLQSQKEGLPTLLEKKDAEKTH